MMPIEKPFHSRRRCPGATSPQVSDLCCAVDLEEQLHRQPCFALRVMTFLSTLLCLSTTSVALAGGSESNCLRSYLTMRRSRCLDYPSESPTRDHLPHGRTSWYVISVMYLARAVVASFTGSSVPTTASGTRDEKSLVNGAM